MAVMSSPQDAFWLEITKYLINALCSLFPWLKTSLNIQRKVRKQLIWTKCSHDLTTHNQIDMRRERLKNLPVFRSRTDHLISVRYRHKWPRWPQSFLKWCKNALSALCLALAWITWDWLALKTLKCLLNVVCNIFPLYILLVISLPEAFALRGTEKYSNNTWKSLFSTSDLPGRKKQLKRFLKLHLFSKGYRTVSSPLYSC